MSNSPFAVGCVIPLMKDLNMSWYEIKATPRFELEGLVAAMSEYNVLHSFDGYSVEDLKETFKKKPEVRQQWNDYQAKRRKYNLIKSSKSFSDAGLI
tara:strand:- start:1745 stop:2035 length:291 start_codon:yes stop_codon:yes gene_type:complete